MYIALPLFEEVEYMSSFQEANTHVYILKSVRESCSCPSCGTFSSRLHSRYPCFVQDLSIQQISIHLQLQVKKIAWIARHMKLSRVMVYADLQRKQKPDFCRNSILSPFLYSIQQWNIEGKTVDEMEEFLRTMGYTDSSSTLNTCVAQVRREHGYSKFTVTVSRSRLLWSLWSETKSEEWKESIPEVFRNEFPDLKRAEELDDWLTTYRNIPFPAIQTFMNYIEKDIEAIRAACSLSFSNGITEGHINRLKTIKRMMYGRASSRLLTQRVLLVIGEF